MYRERGERRRRRRLGRVAVHGRRLGRAAAFRRRQAAVGRRRRAAGAEQMFLFQTNKKNQENFRFFLFVPFLHGSKNSAALKWSLKLIHFQAIIGILN